MLYLLVNLIICVRTRAMLEELLYVKETARVVDVEEARVVDVEE